MMTYLTVEYASGYSISLQPARRLIAEERSEYKAEYRDYMFIGAGEHVVLPHLTWSDLPMWGVRQADGSFPGGSNSVWIITQVEWDALLVLEQQRAEEAERKDRDETTKYLEATIARAEAQREIPTRAEAKRQMKAYNDVYNEGGEGYVPHILSHEEYEAAKERLHHLRGVRP